MSTERGYAAAATWNGKVVVAGGFNKTCSALNSAEQYDPETNQWTAFNSLIVSRCERALLNADNTLFAIGSRKGKAVLSSVERYDAESSTWQQAPELKTGRRSLAAARLRVCYYA